MKRISDFVCKHAKAILFATLILLIPAAIGYFSMKINYDILVYLPKDTETMQGTQILADDFGIKGYAMATIEGNLPAKDVLAYENDIRNIDVVDKVVSIYDVLGTVVPVEMLPSDISDKLYRDDTTVMFITFTTGMNDDETLEAVEKIRDMRDDSNIGGMSSSSLDTKNTIQSEMLTYILTAVVFCLLILFIALDNFLVPLLLMGNIMIAILFNMGTNIIFGKISYITQAIAAVLQLGVTMDFSIFLYHKYREAKLKISGEVKSENTSTDADVAKKAMSLAIRETFKSVAGSSLTTIAGFLALCFMTLSLGTDIGLVMAKGVVFGVVCVLTVLPSALLVCDKLMTKCDHRVLMPKFTHLNKFVAKRHLIIFAVFLAAVVPAYILSTKTESYYNLNDSMPESLESRQAGIQLAEKFNIISPQIVLLDSNLTIDQTNELSDKIRALDGISTVVSYDDLANTGVPDQMLGDAIELLHNDKRKLMLVNSSYSKATTELNSQIDRINEIVKSYDENALIAGEGALTKDLVEIADKDFKNVNFASIGIVFVLMLITLRSGILPFLLIATIEFAIFLNMGASFVIGEQIPFIASIVIGTIQLGATIDYAILLTNNYLDERKKKNKREAIAAALEKSSQSIVVSGLCFFAATIGVGFISELPMIGTLCNMMARGSIISMVVVLLVIPSLLLIFDKLIVRSTMGMKEARKIKGGTRSRMAKAKIKG